MGLSKVVVSIVVLQLFVASGNRVRPSAKELLDADAEEGQTHEEGVVDIEEAMSELLDKADVIHEDVIGKPGTKWYLKVETGKFKHNPFIHGTVVFGGAYAAIPAAPAILGPISTLVGGVGGMAAIDRAAEMLTRFTQQVSIGLSDDWQPRRHPGLHQALKKTASQIASSALPTIVEPALPTQDLSIFPHQHEPAGPTQDLSILPTPPALSRDPAVKKEDIFFASVQRIVGMGNRSNFVSSVIADASRHIGDAMVDQAQAQQAASQAMFHGFSTSQIQQTDRQVIIGLDKALRSDDRKEVEDGMVTLAMLEIVRRSADGGVKVDVD